MRPKVRWNQSSVEPLSGLLHWCTSSHPFPPSPPVVGWTLKLGRGRPYSLRPFCCVPRASRTSASSAFPVALSSLVARQLACGRICFTWLAAGTSEPLRHQGSPTRRSGLGADTHHQGSSRSGDAPQTRACCRASSAGRGMLLVSEPSVLASVGAFLVRLLCPGTASV
jgi:hypothetical protein